MTDNIRDKARAYLALSKAATPKPWDAWLRKLGIGVGDE